MTKEQFNILAALEKGDTLTTCNDSSLVASLTQQGLINDGKITEKGILALEPYRTKRVIFMAAGFGSRLRPVTLETAKPLVKVNGTRIIDTLIDGALAAGIKEIYIVCGYLGEQFEQLKEKYPFIKFIKNDKYDTTNNIYSAYLVRDLLKNAYISEADLLLNNNVFDKYMYDSAYLGIPTDETDDWYFKTDENGVINELGIGSKGCYRMLGISYWNTADGEKLPEHIETTFNMPGGKDEDWCYVPLVSFKDEYKVHVRECAMDDIEEIDTFDELCQVDPSYNSYRQ